MTGTYKAPGSEQAVAFLHIPKTGGTTLNSFLASQFSADETYEIMMRGMSWRVPRPLFIRRSLISFSKIRRLKSAFEQHRVRLVHGHFDMSLSERLPSNIRYFTLLRDPVERAISHYYHYRRMITDPINPLAMRSSLVDWVTNIGLVEMDNGQTRRLAGAMNLPCGRVTPQVFDRAKTNMARYFSVVGLTERFEESLILLQHQFGWPLCRLRALNVGEDRPQRTDVSEEVLRIIRDCNRFDSSLYQFASELLDQALSKIDMANELGRLRFAPHLGAQR